MILDLFYFKRDFSGGIFLYKKQGENDMSEECGNQKKRYLNEPDEGDWEYYRIIRTTLPSFDAVRLNTSVSGLTICSAFLGVAFSTWKYSDVIQGIAKGFPLASVIAFFSCLLALIVGVQFIMKISMFSHFIASSVGVAKDFEDKLIVQEHHRLTHEFNKHKFAGANGDQLFKISLILLSSLAAFGVLFSACAFVSSIR